jgi:hypothetical protein
VSVHDGVAHEPERQMELVQSWLSVQTLPGAHGKQSPPQSTSVSVPSLAAFAHVALRQVPVPHTPD